MSELINTMIAQLQESRLGKPDYIRVDADTWRSLYRAYKNRQVVKRLRRA